MNWYGCWPRSDDRVYSTLGQSAASTRKRERTSRQLPQLASQWIEAETGNKHILCKPRVHIGGVPLVVHRDNRQHDVSRIARRPVDAMRRRTEVGRLRDEDIRNERLRITIDEREPRTL